MNPYPTIARSAIVHQPVAWRLSSFFMFPSRLSALLATNEVGPVSDGWRQRFVWPVTGRRSGLFGAQRVYRGVPGSFHSGADVAVPAGTPVRAPADGPVSWTAHADLAEAAAIVLTDEDRANGPTPPLTGSEALDLAGMAALASEVLGRPVRREVQSEDDLRDALAARGAPPAAADIALGLYRASRAAEFATVDPTLKHLLGRPPITMRELMAEKIAL